MMRYWIRALWALAATAIAGCDPIVLDVMEAETADSESRGETAPDPAPEPPSAIAMRFSQWAIPPMGGSLFEISLWDTPEPDALVLFFASRSQACAAPLIQIDPGADPAACEGQAFWQAIVILPPDRAHPGVIDLDDPGIPVYRAIWEPSCGGGCGNTPGVPGTLEIVSLDEASVSVRLDVDPQQGLTVQNGDYIASICP
jgi:hypothetical protein